MTTPQDGFLPAALRRLNDTVADLTDPLPQLIDATIHYADSRYTQLRQAVAGISRARSGGMGSLPIWPDAFDLLMEIDRAIVDWCAAQDMPVTGAPSGAEQLAALLVTSWRPQDVRLIDEHSGDLENWAQRIDLLLTENHVMELDAACPACNVRTVQRQKAGEMVRQAALQVDADGCRCLECRTEWAPQYFVHLARVIGCPPPAGILE
jgi:hypothetical protein